VSLVTVLGALYARIPLGMRLGLEAMNAACEAVGHPERSFECVHVAGTNGKGSVCAMVESIARAGGKTTGLYTSPHLVKLAERIRVNGEPLSDDELEKVLARALALRPELSFFETVTLAAFLAFQEANVDVAVIEVGIGGRLDATNVIPRPRVAAITRIALDHMDKLGSTVEAIAREKAGIAKPGGRVVLGSVSPSVRAVIQEVATGAQAQLVDAGGDDEPALAKFRAASPLLGAHQWGNVAIACRIARELGFDDSVILQGLHATRWPGRLERIDTERGQYLLDGAHNPDGAAALARYLRSVPAGGDAPALLPADSHSAGDIALVFGALADKAWPEMLDLLAPVTTHRVYVEPHGRAATSPLELAQRHAGEAVESVGEALRRARGLVGRRGVVVVCGSLYLVGEARALLLGLESDPPVAM
jgi:dihydrofolate synthase/folylpolyglutamate synthase